MSIEPYSDDYFIVYTSGISPPAELEFLGGVLMMPHKYIFRTASHDAVYNVLFPHSTDENTDISNVLYEIIERLTAIEKKIYFPVNK